MSRPTPLARRQTTQLTSPTVSHAPSRLLLPTVRPRTPRPTPESLASEWLGLPLHFEVVEERVEVQGYQMYAVEKW